MSHHNYPNHGMPGFTDGDAQSGWSHSERDRPISLPLTIVFPTSDFPVFSDLPNTLSTPVLCDPPYPPAEQQQTQAPSLTYFSYEQLSEGSGQTHGGHDNSVSSSSSADPRRGIQMLSHLDVSGSGRRQRPSYHPSYSELQIPSTSSDSCSPNSADSSASNFSQYQLVQFPASPTYPTEHRPSQGAGTTVAHDQQSMAMFNAFLNRSTPNSQGTAQPHTGVPTAPSPVPYNVQPETPDPATKKRRRKDPRQLEELHKVFALNIFPNTETRRQLARDLDLSPRCVQIWFQNERKKLRDEQKRANAPINQANVTVTPPPETTSNVAHPRGSSASDSYGFALHCRNW